MASAWGNSWGAYWGNSWGSIAVPETDVKTGGKGDNGKDRVAKQIFKPTGLIDRKRLNQKSDPIVEARIEQSIEIAKEIAAENQVRQQLEFNAEQKELLLKTLNLNIQNALALDREIEKIIAEAKKRGIDDDDILVILLASEF